jgi:hypothetical protein
MRQYTLYEKGDYKENNMNTDRENGRGNKIARVTTGSRNPKHGKNATLCTSLAD